MASATSPGRVESNVPGGEGQLGGEQRDRVGALAVSGPVREGDDGVAGEGVVDASQDAGRDGAGLLRQPYPHIEAPPAHTGQP
jgi:hypothetical protein